MSDNTERNILVFGLTAPIGSKIDLLQDSLESEMKIYGYDVTIINVSNLIRDISNKFNIIEDITKNLKIDEKIKFGNKICEMTEEKDYLVKAAIKKIFNKIKKEEKEEDDDESGLKPKKSLAFIIRQLKRPEEIKTLKKYLVNNLYKFQQIMMNI
ncbi:hypothetical protein [Zymomonas mobilis]|uniref:hypothetical protein n=1 Tax=Zymomonas mobilis TaxID=542 RepID=UPI0021C3E9E0|nr:hypothetical protein [Zymomonas mobilis]MCP9308067.1 hypothetical protein [Zymomonas mobilis]